MCFRSSNGGGISTKKCTFPVTGGSGNSHPSSPPLSFSHLATPPHPTAFLEILTTNWTQISGKHVVRTFVYLAVLYDGKKGKKIIGVNAKWMRKWEYARLILNYKSICMVFPSSCVHAPLSLPLSSSLYENSNVLYMYLSVISRLHVTNLRVLNTN